MQTQIQSIVEPAAALHRELLDDLILCKEEHKEPVKQLEICVQICTVYLSRLFSLIPETYFFETKNEIDFFKNWKPKFASELEYYKRLYHVALFGHEDRIYFERELNRMEKILIEHAAFANYYDNGNQQNDHTWFVQGQAPHPTNLCMLPWETNPNQTSARDGWVSGLLAVRKYIEWIKERLETIHSNQL
jgi:hypothetical protein